MNTYLQQLKKQNIFQEDIYSYLEFCSFKKNTCILHQGEKIQYLYILVNGKVKTCHTTSNGLMILNAFSKPITVIGEIEFLNDIDIINDIYTLEDCSFFRISIHQYKNQLINDTLFMRYLAKSLAIKLYKNNHNTSISINYPVENRLASYLMACRQNNIVDINLVQSAEMLGCSYRQLQRTIHHFIEMKYIEKLKRGSFFILDPQHLDQLGQDLYYL